MTDRIDLDEMGNSDEETDDANHGDWFWRDEGSPEDDPGPAEERVDLGATEEGVPHVPRESHGDPVGVPVEDGGAGAGADAGAGGESSATPGVPEAGDDGDTSPGSAAHGGDAASEPSEMTLAFTYEALRSFEDLHAALADAESWADWLGVVGHVDAHVINKFQRDNRIDLDFFNGSGTGPAERLAAIENHSMFYAERMVLVGTDGEESIAAAADWEFVSLTEAAEKAGWTLA